MRIESSYPELCPHVLSAAGPNLIQCWLCKGKPFLGQNLAQHMATMQHKRATERAEGAKASQADLLAAFHHVEEAQAGVASVAERESLHKARVVSTAIKVGIAFDALSELSKAYDMECRFNLGGPNVFGDLDSCRDFFGIKEEQDCHTYVLVFVKRFC